MLRNGKWAMVAGFVALGGAETGWAQAKLSYPGCSDVTQANFNKVVVVDKIKDPTLDEVIRFSVSKNGTLLYAERAGTIKELKTDGSIVTLGKINVYPPTSKLKGTRTDGGNINNEFGLVGLAVDPDFDHNHFIYVNYQANGFADHDGESHLSRFTVANDALDMASEKILMKWPIQQYYCCHTGGDIRLDSKGDLWSSIGNNTMNPPGGHDGDASAFVDESIPHSDADDQGHSANSNDYRGKIIRIHPTPDGAYTIPAGNFRDYYLSVFPGADVSKIKPEIYTMGHRNPYTIGLDDVNGWLVWGDVGPDNGGTQFLTEEYNLVTHPGFMGWPYFAGAESNPNYRYKLNKDPAAPMNTSSDNTGVQKLPPAQPAIIGYSEGCAISGPVYRWSSAQTSDKKLPAHFDGKWFVADWRHSDGIKLVTVDNSGTKSQSMVTFFDSRALNEPLELYVAPDGVLYGLEYNAVGPYLFAAGGVTPTFGRGTAPMRIVRFEYSGPACAASTSLADEKAIAASKGKTSLVNLGLVGERSVNLAFGSSGFRMYDLQGKLAWEYKANAAASTFDQKIPVPFSVGNGVYRVKYEF